MTTLAQKLVDQYSGLPRERFLALEGGGSILDCYDVAFKFLARPFEGNHVAVSRMEARTVANIATQKAEPIVFDDRAAESAANISLDTESFKIALLIARPPYVPIFVEWHAGNATYGCLVTEEPNSYDMILFRWQDGFPMAYPVAVARWILGALDGVLREGLLLKNPFTSSSLEDQRYVAASGLFQTLSFFALTEQNGLIEWSKRRCDWHQNRVRARHGRPALLSFNVCKLRLPRPDESHEDVRVQRGKGVRFHHVIGHLRLIGGDTSNPRVIWVADDWRGDRDLGTVMKTRLAAFTERTKEIIKLYPEHALRAIPPSLWAAA